MAVILRPLPEDKAVAELRRMVQAASDQTRLKIWAQIARRKPTAQLMQLQRELQAILLYLDQYMQLWTGTQIPAAWQRGYSRAVGALHQAGIITAPAAGLTGVNISAANLVAENLVRQFEASTIQLFIEATGAANRFIGRRVDDIYRRLGLEVGAQRILTGVSYTAVAADAMAKLEAEGIFRFTDAANRRWSLEAYTQMLGRTVLREADAMALVTGLTDNGHDLVYVPPHAPTCARCAMVEDRVYSITGRTDGYPVLPHWPPHPNCRHPLEPYVPGADRNLDATRERSNRPFEDQRSDAARAAYDQTQERNRLIRHERYLAQLKATRSVPLGKRGEELARLARAGDPEAKLKLGALRDRLLAGVDDRLAETRRKLRELPVPIRTTGGYQTR